LGYCITLKYRIEEMKRKRKRKSTNKKKELSLLSEIKRVKPH